MVAFFFSTVKDKEERSGKQFWDMGVDTMIKRRKQVGGGTSGFGGGAGDGGKNDGCFLSVPTLTGIINHKQV